MLHILFGQGQGKSVTSFGLALRAVGRHRRVKVLQFMKGLQAGEFLGAHMLGPSISVELLGRHLPEKYPTNEDGMKQLYNEYFVNYRSPSNTDIELVFKGLERAKECFAENKWDMVILDEILTAWQFRMLKVDDILDMLKSRNCELVLTGSKAPKQLLHIADYVTEFKYHKHPFELGIAAREGFDF